MSRALCRFLIPILAVAWCSAALADDNEIAIHGLASQGYMRSTEYNFGDQVSIATKNGTFAFTELAVNISVRTSPKLRIGAQFLGRDFGSTGNSEVIVDWAFGDYRWRDTFGLRAGKIKLPNGFYNQVRDIDYVRNSILLPQSVYDESYRDILQALQGFGIYGNLPVGSTSTLEYEALTGFLETDNSPTITANITSSITGGTLTSSSIIQDPAYAAALRWNTPLTGLRVGGTFFGHREEVDASLLAMGTSLELDIANESKTWWVLSAEFAPSDLMLIAELRRMKSLLSIDISGPAPTFPARMEVDTNNGGYYLQGTYRLRPWFEAGTIYSVNIRDWDDKDGKEYAAVVTPPGSRPREDFERFNHDLTFTARFDVTEAWLVKLEAHLMKGVYHIDTSTIPADTPLEERWQLFAVKTTFIF